MIHEKEILPRRVAYCKFCKIDCITKWLNF